MLTREFRILLISLSLFYTTNGEEQLETFCNINGKKALQYVSEKFLSISIDPAVVLAGLNLSEASLRLAQHLSPAYIRIAGPSTKFVKYVDNEDKFDDRLSEDGSNVVVTPSMWFGINEWLSLANLTPVFGINDVETTRGVWNPKSTLPLLEISDKLNVSCYWQLGFDTSQKDELQYKQDLSIFAHLLAAFPERNDSWKIVGSDISSIQPDHMENVMTELQDIATAVMWEPQEVTEDSFPEKDISWKILHQQHKPPVKIWTTIPKAEEPVSFSSALLWATQIGEAARAGFDVVFRQPRLLEMFSDTPAYWFSLLHKKLMGSNVLEAKTTAYHPGSSVYAHCTRKQNSFVRRGAITVMVVNRNLDNYKVKVKLGSPSNEKTIEVLSYILTSTGENSTDIFLNGEQLTPDLLSGRNPFQPKLRRAKLKSHVSLEVPSLSIGFFVLPGARVPVCINEEKEMDLLLEEIAEDQNIPLSEEIVLKLSSRGSFANNPTLEEIAQRMKKEMQSDEKFYNAGHSLNFNQNALSQRMQDAPVENNVNQRGRKFFIEKAKLAERQKKRNDMERRREELKEFLSEKARASDFYKHEPKFESKSKNLELTSKEVENILKDRARARAARRNIFFTDDELDALIQKASKQFSKSKFKRSLPDGNKRRRDINMQLIDRKMSLDPTSSKNSIEFKQLPSSNEYSKNKRTIRKRRDLNMKRLDYKAKLEDKRQRMEDKKYEMLGNAQNIKNTIKDKMRKLKYVKRLKRDINMDLIKIKADGQKINPQREAQKKQPKSLFKDKEEKEATIRKPGQTSAELLEELEEENKSIEEVKPTKKVVYAELAVPEDDEEDEEDDFFKKNIKSNKHNKNSGNFFGDANPRKEGKRNKQGKKKNSDDIQFLTASEEFTDIEEDLPCIHEFFGPPVTDNDNTKDKKIIGELGEIQTSDKKVKKKKSEKRKMTELADVGSSEGVSMELLRRKRAAEESTEDDNFDVICQSRSSESKANSYDNANGETMDYSELERLGFYDDTQGLAEYFANRCLPCSGINGPSEAEIPRYKRANSESGGYKTSLKKSRKKKSSKPNKVKRNGLDQLRKKRDLHQETQGNEKLPDIKKEVQYELKELQQKIIKDKLKFEEEKMRNKIKLLQLKKKQEQECMANERGDILEEINNIKNEKQNAIQEQLTLLKKKLEQRKKEIDKLLYRDLILHEKLEEQKLGMLKDIMHEGKHTVNDAIDIEPRTKQEPNMKEEHIRTETSSIANVAKRSIVNPKGEVFGNYHSLTKNLKTWKPSDIHSLKRDVSFMKSPKLKPITDYRISKNGQFNMRRKRSTDTSANDLENEIDGFTNEIEKDSRTSTEKRDYVHLVPYEDLGKGTNGGVSLESGTESSADTSESKAEDSRSANPIFYTFNGDIAKEIESDLDNMDSTEILTSRMSDNIQKVPEKSEQQAFDKFVSNIAGFFTNIGRQLGHYLRHMVNN